MRSIKDEFGLYREQYFDDMLRLERKRTERSQTPFVMVMFEIRHLVKRKAKASIHKLTDSLDECFREIDIKGWYKTRSVIGVICPEVAHLNIKKLQQKVKENDISISLWLGSEIHCHATFNKKSRLATLNGNGKYILVELPMIEVPKDAQELFFELVLDGFSPILAHPERNLSIQQNLTDLLTI